MRAILVNMLLISPAFVFAQARFVNLSSTIPTSKELYIGVENYIKVEGVNNSSKNRRLAVSHGHISIIDSDYRVSINSENNDTLNYYINNKLILSEVFTARKVPDYVARLSRSLDTVLTTNQILANPFLSVMVPGCNFKVIKEVRSFIASFIDSHGETMAELYQNSNLLSEAQIKEVKKLGPGGKIFFDNIRAIGGDGRTIMLRSFTVLLK